MKHKAITSIPLLCFATILSITVICCKSAGQMSRRYKPLPAVKRTDSVKVRRTGIADIPGKENDKPAWPMFRDSALVLQQSTYFEQEKSTDPVPYIISGISAVIALSSLIFTCKTFKKNIKNRNLAFIGDADKMIINEPGLWEFYDEHIGQYSSCPVSVINGIIEVKDGKESFTITGGKGVVINAEDISKQQLLDKNGNIVPFNTGGNTIPDDEPYQLIINGRATIISTPTAIIEIERIVDKKLKGKIDAYVYYKLNHFEAILNEGGKGWKKYMIYCLENSTVFKNHLSKIIAGKDGKYAGLYHGDTIEKWENILKGLKSNSAKHENLHGK